MCLVAEGNSRCCHVSKLPGCEANNTEERNTEEDTESSLETLDPLEAR